MIGDRVYQWLHDEMMPKIRTLQTARLSMRPGDVASITAITSAQLDLLPQLDRLVKLLGPYLTLRS